MQKDNVKCKIIFLSILFLGVFSLAGTSRAATYAINPSCGIDGDGTTWSCGNGAGHAWNSLPPSEKISRGDTIYIGSGTIEHAADAEPPYGYKMNKSLDNPPTWITFKKATVVEHGPSSGWNDAYASGQTIFRSLGPYNTILYTGSSDTGYYQFDGVYGSKSKDESTYGFLFKYYAAIPSPAGVSALVYGNEQPNITWQQLKFNHVAFLGTPDNRDVAADNAAIRGSGSYTTFVNSLFKNFNNAIEAPSNNLTLDTVIFTDAAVGKSAHNQYISYGEDNLTIKNSEFYATPQSQLMYSTSDQPDSGFITCNWSGGKDIMDNWQLYNNLIVGNAGYGPFVGTADQCAGCNTNAKIYSNTFVDATAQVSFHDLQGSIVQPGGACSGSHLACFSSGNFVTNNLYYHSAIIREYQYPALYKGTTADYNWWDASSSAFPGDGIVPAQAHNPANVGGLYTKLDIFVNSLAGDYRLAAGSPAINQGTALGSLYNLDKEGTPRPQGAGWDIGAYEYVQGEDTTPPAAPTGLRVN